MKPTSLAGIAVASWLAICAGCGAKETPASRNVSDTFVSTAVASFSEPWAMTFLPDGRLLVTEKKGALKLVDVATGRKGDVAGIPTVAYGGQGGFGDVILHPGFDRNQLVYLSFAERVPADDQQRRGRFGHADDLHVVR